MKNTVENGFTLVELMIVLVIVSILAAIAIPSYRDNVIDTKRRVGTAELLKVQNRQEQYFVNNKGYATDLTSLGYPANGYYVDDQGQAGASSAGSVYLIQLAAGATTASFTLQAVPQGGQAEDTDCGTLSLTSRSAKGASLGTVADCW